MEKTTKNIIAAGLAAILLAAPLKKANAGVFDKLFKNSESIGIEYAISQPDYAEIRQANEEKNSQMSSYIPDWKNIPNIGQLEMRGIAFKDKIAEIDKIKFLRNIHLNVIAGIYGGKSEVNYNQAYDGDYRQVESRETLDVPLEFKVGIGARNKKHGRISCSAGLGLLFDYVSYSKSRTTTFSDLTSGKTEVSTIGIERGYFLEAAGEYRLNKNLSAEICIGLKRNNVNTCGKEKFTDYADSSNNYEKYKEVMARLGRTDMGMRLTYRFAE